MKPTGRTTGFYEAVIGVCFLLGGIIGIVSANGADYQVLSQRVTGTLDAFSSDHSGIYLFFTNFLTQLKYPVLLFLFGFTVFGSVLIPGLVAMKGYVLSFAFCAFLRVLDSHPYGTILAVYGVQSVVSIPCLILLSMAGLRIAWTILRVNFLHIGSGQARSGTPDLHSLIACTAIAAFGACVCAVCDTFLTPTILRMLMG